MELKVGYCTSQSKAHHWDRIHSMELKGGKVPPGGRAITKNPFNGIERYCKIEAYLLMLLKPWIHSMELKGGSCATAGPRAPSGIHSMELKDIQLLKPSSVPEANPFNGIESARLHSVERRLEHKPNPFNGIESSTPSSLCTTRKTLNPFNGIERSLK